MGDNLASEKGVPGFEVFRSFLRVDHFDYEEHH